MTAGLSSFTTPSSYWQASRAPRYSLLFALPLLLFYQTLAVLLSHGARSVRNGADVILQSLFVALAGNWGPLLFMLCLIGGGLWLLARDMRAHGSPPPGPAFAPMAGGAGAAGALFRPAGGSGPSGRPGVPVSAGLAPAR